MQPELQQGLALNVRYGAEMKHEEVVEKLQSHILSES